VPRRRGRRAPPSRARRDCQRRLPSLFPAAHEVMCHGAEAQIERQHDQHVHRRRQQRRTGSRQLAPRLAGTKREGGRRAAAGGRLQDIQLLHELDRRADAEGPQGPGEGLPPPLPALHPAHPRRSPDQRPAAEGRARPSSEASRSQARAHRKGAVSEDGEERHHRKPKGDDPRGHGRSW